MMEVHRVLAHPSEDITQKMVQAMEIATTDQWGPCEVRLLTEEKRYAVPWIDGLGKTGSDGVGVEDLGVKPGEDESVGKRRAPQFEAQELELKQQPASRERKQETQKAPLDPEDGTREAPPDLEERTQKAPPDPEEGTQEALPGPEEKIREAPLDPEQETRKAPSDREGEIREAPSDPEEEDTR